ncbi:hypothetical protein [Chondromyces apiculatus]|uniref:Uncharacterized protein n=1 Tax=Chondromyces apiculatus DSM 436 TaxID=1192034 RepID=A0A017TF82_9BACT|nr:hypothetical protein [Chondromyces apiculatus]EYF07480.1 Hypothetical protein CAP_0233 [Chondromyces apiculatus DSM 436]
MSLLDIAALYVLVGVACAVAIYRAERAAEASERGAVGGAGGGKRLGALGTAALAIPLWPLWAPVALGRQAPTSPAHAAGGVPREAGDQGASRDSGAAGSGFSSPAAATAARIEDALAECVSASAGTPLEALLPPSAAARIGGEVGRAARRHAELSALIRREGFDIAGAEERLASLERAGAAPRVVTTAKLHLENVRRLVSLRDRDAAALEELSDLVQALRAQLHVARYAGGGLSAREGSPGGESLAGTSGIVAEVWARVEGLGAVMSPEDGADTAAAPFG